MVFCCKQFLNAHDMNQKEIDQLFRVEQNYMEKLHSIATSAMKDEKLIVSNLLNKRAKSVG
jgi:predicted XRE-type DNA-binding protein